MRVNVAVVVPVAVVLAAVVERAEGTIGLAAAALPVVTTVGGLAALKVLKYVGLSKLKSSLGGGVDSLGSSLSDLATSGHDYYQDPFYAQPLYAAGGPPSFYIVPANHFEDYRRRGRRDTADIVDGVVGVGEGAYWGVVSGLDSDACARRLVCQLAKTPRTQLNQGGQLIMALFSSTTAAPSLHAQQTARGAFEHAYWVGRTAHDPASVCARVYSSCHATPQALLEALAEVKQ